MEIARLRTATADDHAAVEGSVPLMSPGLTRPAYTACLLRLYGIAAAWEEAAPVGQAGWLRALLQARERRALLEADLRWLGVQQMPPARAALPTLGSEARVLGAMYVMEGSRLGGQLIAKHVAAVLHLPQNQGNTFFRGYGEHTGTMWKEFCEVLRVRVEDAETEDAIQAAKAMFAAFGLWMQDTAAPGEEPRT